MLLALKWVIVAIMAIHGLIHLMGALNELGLAKIEEAVGTLFALPKTLQKALGAVWFISVVLFIISALGLVTGQPWWWITAIPAVIISQILIIIWWPAAKFGTIPNVLIVIGLILIH